ncbi:MAG: hypothetical protein ACD_18C00084G0004 [uncultured bacterium]|nr:MAG: hypothetical protein ACD_18C00084G0004 [uncultured bacterium]OGH83584.1 MAG: hypothetical protein A2488_02065 [Candidatus Magasanikbacteria bacterium RIFOXYC12_FULL_32_21b]OGH91542.1 MAG: hypothetical protein A2507_01730 [Candidatus Magasanikbacteria bacterium RIFOXYD12_FULL_33_17]HAO52521.1 hypothetical protein [Candidatus Magasanikbacteria bacterium]
MYYWHVENEVLFLKLKESIKKNYPTLLVYIEDNIVYLKGTLRIEDKRGVILDSFKIKVEIPFNFPNEIPKVWEIDNKIPKIADRHFNVDGTACLAFRDAVFLYWNEDSDILDFFDKFVKPFFIWQIEYSITGGNNKKEAHGHGIIGAFEFYKDISCGKDIYSVYKFILYLSKEKIKGHWNCYCGSGKKLRGCHYELLKKYKEKIRISDVTLTIKEINESSVLDKNNSHL